MASVTCIGYVMDEGRQKDKVIFFLCVCFIDLLPKMFWHWHVWLISKLSYFCHKGNLKKKKRPVFCYLSAETIVSTRCYSIALSKIHLPIILFPSSPSFHFLHNRIHRSRDMSYSVQTMGDSQHPQGRNKGSEANGTFWLSVRERETERESLCVDICVRNLTGVLWKAKSWLQTTEHTHIRTHRHTHNKYPSTLWYHHGWPPNMTNTRRQAIMRNVVGREEKMG